MFAKMGFLGSFFSFSSVVGGGAARTAVVCTLRSGRAVLANIAAGLMGPPGEDVEGASISSFPSLACTAANRGRRDSSQPTRTPCSTGYKDRLAGVPWRLASCQAVRVQAGRTLVAIVGLAYEGSRAGGGGEGVGMADAGRSLAALTGGARALSGADVGREILDALAAGVADEPAAGPGMAAGVCLPFMAGAAA
jgi:hypothetical protein